MSTIRLTIALALILALAPSAAATAAPPGLSQHTRCATDVARGFAPLNASPTSIEAEHTPFGPPENPQVGDEWLWYTWRLAGFPVADLLPATVRGMGDHCYVVVENSQWNVNIDQAQVDHIIERFDNASIGSQPSLGIYDINVATFGTPPDRLDDDERIYIYYYDFDIGADGYFWWFDEFPDGTQAFASNECEVVYINCSDFDPAGDYLTAVVAHEFEHMIHWEYDANESSWVDEGLGELAMNLYGRPDNISAFNSNPDNNLTVWNGAWADYIKTYLWSLYFYERYGGATAVYDIVHEPANSTQGYDAVLDVHGYTEDFDDVFADWVVANYLDDPTLGDGRWGYLGDDLPAFGHAATHSTYPVGPASASVNHWATDYLRFLDVPSGLQFGFDGGDITSYALWALELDPVQPTRVTRLTLDGSQAGSIDLPDVGSLYEHAVLVVANNSNIGATGYVYDAATGVAAIDPVVATSVPRQPILHPPAPNPFNPAVAIRYELPWDGMRARVTVVDGNGRHVRTLLDQRLAGSGSIDWDGKADGQLSVASGVYFIRLETARGVEIQRAVLVR